MTDQSQPENARPENGENKVV